MNNASLGWDYSNNATEWGFKIYTFKVTQFNTIFGHFSTSMIARTACTKSDNQQQNWLHPPQEEEVAVYFMIVFHSTPHTVEKLNEHRNYLSFARIKYLHNSTLCAQIYCINSDYRCFLHTNLWWIWNSVESNAKHSTRCCPSWEGICGAPCSPGCGHCSFWYESPIISSCFPCLWHRMPKTMR